VFFINIEIPGRLQLQTIVNYYFPYSVLKNLRCPSERFIRAGFFRQKNARSVICRQLLNDRLILLMVQLSLNNNFTEILTFTFVILEPKAKNLIVQDSSIIIADGSFLTMTNEKIVILAGSFGMKEILLMVPLYLIKLLLKK